MVKFLHVGFSKCASTYIQSVLNSSDQINLIYKSKEYSLNEELGRDYNISEDMLNIESDEHIVLPSYHPTLKVRGTRLDDVNTIFQNIYQLEPNAKIILVIRNHIELIKSRYSQYIVGGGGDLDINDFCKKLNGDFSSNENEDYYQNYYFYIIQLIEDIFGKENTLVMLFEDFKRDNNTLIVELEKFIGVDLQDSKPGLLSMRKGMSLQGLRHLRKLNSYVIRQKQDLYGNKDAKIPLVIYIQIIRLLRGIDYYFGKGKINVADNVRYKLNRKFKNDNELLANHLNRDLKKLGYHY